MKQEVSKLNVRLTVLEGLLRTLVATDNEMKGIRKWQLVKEDQRNRQKQCRSKKNADEIEEKLSRPPNQKGQCLTEICLDVPGISEGMMHFLTTKVKGDPVAWFVYIIRESALDAFRFLFCLYNNSFQEKWIKNAGSPYKVLRGWKIGKPRQPDWKRATHSAIFPSKVPHGEWQQPSREKYANCWCWKVFEVGYMFLQKYIVRTEAFKKAEGQEVDLFNRVVRVMSQLSDYQVLPEKDWAPTNIDSIEDWSEDEAKRACHLVAPEVAILTETFQKGQNQKITDYFD